MRPQIEHEYHPHDTVRYVERILHSMRADRHSPRRYICCAQDQLSVHLLHAFLLHIVKHSTHRDYTDANFG
ncbi:hypothetical protein WL86_29465 [Burkholderia diffusa]|nr:hypothetical protein WL86_29465 [Burkholderia diffusa]